MKPMLINLLSFKVGWAASVAAAAASVPAAGAAVAMAVVLFHLARTGNARQEVILLGCAALIGVIWESLLVAAGLLRYESGLVVPGFAPYWIVGMWVLFATTLNVGMRWLRRNALAASAVGAIGGPLAFFAGERMGAVDLSEPVLSLAAIAAGWAVLLPLLVRVAVRFDGHRLSPVAATSAPLIR